MMTRNKVKFAFIGNDSSRKATLNKRKKGLLKKVKELSTLCGITTCAIIYSPYGSNPEVWPSTSSVQRVISDFRTLPEIDQHKRMVDQETFLRQRIAKTFGQLKREKKDNREQEMTQVMFQCLVEILGMLHLNIMDLNDLGYMIDQYTKGINRRIEILGSAGMEMGESSNAAAAPSSEGIGSLTFAMATNQEVYSSSSSAPAANFFNSIQQQNYHHHRQQFRHHVTPRVGFYQNLNMNQNHNQNQQELFVEMVNHHGQMSYAAEHMNFPFMNDNHHNRDHHHNYHQQQHQQIPGYSSIAPTTFSSSSIIPVTTPNPTNNTWFR